jgi:FAD/FMN-containing dehydrogenase
VAGQDIFSLRGSTYGTFGIPRDWTNKADPEIFCTLNITPPFHSQASLLALTKLLDLLHNQVKSKKEI